VISEVYTAIPALVPDGFYGERTAESVRAFQGIFGLPKTGAVDFATWYKISQIYVGITKIAELP
jgi:peptidoglycan hydrolase-like protein with peptidoglycan-binding domain